MKVIVQLIRHFWQRGVLTPAEVDYLLRHGFVRQGDLPGFRPGKSSLDSEPLVDTEPVEFPDELELTEESLIRRSAARRGRRHEPRTSLVDDKELVTRLQEEFDQRGRDLTSVLAFGRRIADVAVWQDAVSELRAARAERFYRELCGGLRDESILLGDLWQASDPEPFHLLLSDDEMSGRCARAYEAVLIASGAGELGKYAWILKHDEMQALFNLKIVHARLLNCLARMFRRNRQLLTQAIGKNCDREQVWALILLYNAHRKARPPDRPRYGRDYGPLEVPMYPTWREAWTCALRMDRPTVARFLLDCYGGDQLPPLDERENCRKELFCPVGWRIPDEAA